MEIIIKIGEETQLFAGLNETKTARRIFEALPLESKGSTWGEEIYFTTPVEAPIEEDAREVLEAGELGYWPDMQAFCIFYGPTPASKGHEIRAAGPVNVFGKIKGDIAPLKNIKGLVNVVVEKR
ncbi:MAG: cyclophilin-like fold protein [Bacillota bacterium]|nr:cyclophilin-like fold protein [Bacillota bacterium]